jgi:restriction endonuclease S subunit
VGAEGRKEVKLDFFESIQIPVPDIDVQKAILSHKKKLSDELELVKQQLINAEIDIERMILGEKK